MPTSSDPATHPGSAVVEPSSHPASASVDHATATPWLSIVGLGEDGLDGLCPAARRAIEGGEIVFGGVRHLRLAGDAIRGEARSWPRPFDDAPELVAACRGRRVVVLASGDPFFYGVGSVLARTIPSAEMRVWPAPSSVALAAARLGWAQQDITAISLHGRPLDLIRPHLQAGRRLIALTSDGAAPADLAALLTATGFGASRMVVLEALGGPRERVRDVLAADFALDAVDDLNVVAITLEAAADARALARTAGRSEDLFEHDHQITKQEIRAVTLAALAPQHGALLWDIGAGSGSVAIEWMLADPSLRAVAIEPRADRLARIQRNAASFGVPSLVLIEGQAPEALAGLPKPEAIFIGGGASKAGVIEAAVTALRPGGRLVVNAVTLETEAVLIAHHAQLGGNLTRLEIARAEPVGGFRGWRPAMPVVQWRWVKP